MYVIKVSNWTSVWYEPSQAGQAHLSLDVQAHILGIVGAETKTKPIFAFILQKTHNSKQLPLKYIAQHLYNSCTYLHQYTFRKYKIEKLLINLN